MTKRAGSTFESGVVAEAVQVHIFILSTFRMQIFLMMTLRENETEKVSRLGKLLFVSPQCQNTINHFGNNTISSLSLSRLVAEYIII